MTTKTTTKKAITPLAALESERAALVSGIATQEADHAALSETLPRLQAAALRGGDSAPRDQAETQIAELVLTISRKRAALTAITADLDMARQVSAAQERESWLHETQAVRTEAGQIADQLDHDLLNADLWARLWALYDHFTALRRQIEASGGAPIGATYLHPWHSPARLLASKFNALRIVAAQHPDRGQTQQVITARAALGLDADIDSPPPARERVEAVA